MSTSSTINMRDGLSPTSARRNAGGFTLVEILIVVVILGILAAIVIPRFSDASKQARESTLKDDLRFLRMQIEVYKAQHLNVAPGASGDFVAQMTGYTDDRGTVSASFSTVYRYGPYLSGMPQNPLTGRDTIRVITSGAVTDGIDETSGWNYKPSTGEIVADKLGSDSNAIPYAQY